MAEGGDGQDNEVRRKQEVKVTSTCMKKGGGGGGGRRKEESYVALGSSENGLTFLTSVIYRLMPPSIVHTAIHG